MIRATCLPPWIAPCATPGTSLPFADHLREVADHEHFGWPGIDRSGCTSTRPARSHRRAEPGGQRRRLHARRPQHRARADVLALVADLDGHAARVDRGDAACRRGPRRAAARASCFAASESFSGYVRSTRSCPRTARRAPRSDRSNGSRSRACAGRSRRARRRARRRSARRRRPRTSATRAARAGSLSRSAASYARKIRRRISSASSIDLRPGASGAQSSLPKYECVAPVATIR